MTLLKGGLECLMTTHTILGGERHRRIATRDLILLPNPLPTTSTFRFRIVGDNSWGNYVMDRSVHLPRVTSVGEFYVIAHNPSVF